MQNCPKDLSDITDSQLVALARQRHSEAFNELIRRHSQRCLAFALSILHNPGEAEEECQNGFCNAYTHLDQFHGDAEFVTWLLKIVENQCLMLLRRRSRIRLVHFDDVHPDREMGIAQIRSTCANPEQQFGKREILCALRIEIRRIPPLFRQMLLLGELEELPMRELAAKLGISLGAAKSRLARARGELRQRMLRHYTPRLRHPISAADRSFRKQLLLEINKRRI